MDTAPIDNARHPQLSPSQTVKLRDAAKQFEAMLLTQLTSVMNNIGSDEDSMFGKDGGADLAKKMFSEQLATAMAESGGIGIGDTILRQFGLEPAVSTSRALPQSGIEDSPVLQTQSRGDAPRQPLINRSVSPGSSIATAPLTNDFGIVSTDAAENAAASDESWRAAFASPSNGIDYTNPANMEPGKPSPQGYSMPVEGRISSRFGNRFHPIDGKQKFHGGIDIAAPRGTPIGAAADGEVVFAGRRGGYGNLVIIRHADGRLTRYAHAETINVEQGQIVQAGENIATVGSTGKATGPHLHFEVRENGKPVNPFEHLVKVSTPISDK